MPPQPSSAAASQNNKCTHLYALDALRGLAALSVVLWHWSTFPTAGRAGEEYQTSSQPLFELLFPFYLGGFRAVDLFFCLSGFVFFWLYEAKIRQKKVTPGEFALLRFSRLYPLHFVTLIVVTCGQFYMRSTHGYDFMHGHNDLWHFFLQLFMASSWGFEDGFSFNGPIWSVSVEVLLYGCFFAMCRLGFTRWWQLVLGVIAGLYVMVFVIGDVGRGITGFFAGCLASLIWLRIESPKKWLPYLVTASILLWIVVPLNAKHLYLLDLYEALPIQLASGKGIIGSFVQRICDYLYQLALFPLTILCLATWESGLKRNLSAISWLGNLSYSSYLWHFPLQLAFYAVAVQLGYDWRLFMSPWILLLFFAVLVTISILSFEYIERPSQTWIRSVWNRHVRK